MDIARCDTSTWTIRSSKSSLPSSEALADTGRVPLVLVGDEVKSPPAISVYWIEEQLAALEQAAVGSTRGGND